MIREEYRCIENIKCNIKYEKIKNSYIQIKSGDVIIKVPNKSSMEYVEQLVIKRKDWILKKLKEQESSRRSQTTYKEGSIIYVLGKPYILKIIYIESKQNKTYIKNTNIYCEIGNIKQNFEKEDVIIKKQIDKYYKFIAREEVPAAMEYIQNKTGLRAKEINIKNLKATWGICSSKKKISINQNLMAYSRHAIEYVCLHEVCHLKYMNHSKEFWNMVAYYMPDYKIAKKELKS